MSKELDKAISKGINKMSSIRRSRNRIKRFYNKYKDCCIFFATFTFNKEHYMPNLKSFTKYLRRNNCVYCLYPDYGEKNKRYHLHGYIVLKNMPILKNKRNYLYTDEILNRYGFIKLILVDGENNRMAKYTIKYSIKFDDTIGKKYNKIITNDRKSVDKDKYKLYNDSVVDITTHNILYERR